MIIFAVTRNGFMDLKEIIFSEKHKVWVGNGVLSKEEIEEFKGDLTVINYPINPSNIEEIEGAIHTISEHHPEERIWIERVLPDPFT